MHVNEKDITYEQAFARLEEISSAMSAAALPLEKLMELYEEGMELAAFCEKLLKSYEAKLEKISKRTLEAEIPPVEGEACEEYPDEEVPF